MTQITTWVHRYTLRDLLDDSLDLFKERAITLLLAGAIPYVLVVAYLGLMRFYFLPGNFMRDLSDISELFQNSTYLLYLLGLIVCSGVAYTISTLVQCRIAVLHALGQSVSLLDVYRKLLKPFFSSIVVSIIYGIFLSAGLSVTSFLIFIVTMLVGVIGLAAGGSSNPVFAVIIAIVAAITTYLAIMLAWILVSVLFLTAPAFMVNEDCGPFAALGKSFRFAMANYKANVVALYALVHIPIIFTALAIVIQLLLSMGMQYLTPAVVDVVGGTLAILVSSLSFTAILGCQSAVAYVDGKCRLETLDLRVLAREIGLEEEIEQVFRPAVQPVRAPGNPRNRPMPQPQYGGTPNYQAPPYGQPPLQGAATSIYPDYSAPPPPLTGEVAPSAPAVPPPADVAEETLPEPPATPHPEAEEAIPSELEVTDVQ